MRAVCKNKNSILKYIYNKNILKLVVLLLKIDFYDTIQKGDINVKYR